MSQTFTIYGTYTEDGRRYLNATIEGAVLEALDDLIESGVELGHEVNVVERINDILTSLPTPALAESADVDVCSGDVDCTSALHVHGCDADHGRDVPTSAPARVLDRHARTSDVRNSARAQGVESEAGDGLGVALCSPGSPSAADGLRGAQRGAERVSDAEAAEWGRLAGEATEPGEPDAAFIAAARTAVPRLLAEREALRAEVERLHGQARVEDVIYLDVCQQLDHERAVRTEIAAERDRARGTAAHLEAENALLSEGVERLSSKIYKLRREAMDDLMALDRVLYAKACELFDNPKEAE